MIEITTKNVDGVDFITDVRLLEPDDTVGGLPVHHVVEDRYYKEVVQAVKMMGLRRVGFDIDY